jgi:hypothetical protein
MILEHNAESWTLTKRIKSKIQAVGIKFLRSITGNKKG